MTKEPYMPTRTCPHRWCKPLHMAPAPFAIAIMAFDLWHNWVFLVMFASVVIATWWLPRIIHFKPRPRSKPATVKEIVQDLRESPTALDLEMQDVHYAGTGWRMLEVRKGWARVAVACDIILVTVTGLAAVAIFSNPTEAGESASEAALDTSMLIAFAVAIAFFGFAMYAHKKATQPRKPKKAWLPAFLRTNV